MATNEYVYEITDNTEDEMHYPLGIFLTLEAAIAAIDECKDPTDLGSEISHDDYAKVVVWQREIGWSGNGTSVFARKWEQKYNEGKDEYEWHTIKKGETK